MNIIEWVKRKTGMLMFALANVEKDSFGQKHTINSPEGVTQQVGQGTLADDLINGELTQEVKNLRWRTYKVLQHSRGFKTTINVEGSPSTKKHPLNLRKLKLDEKEKYPLEILFKNSETTINISDVIADLDLIEGELSIDSEDLNSKLKPKSYLSVIREIRPTFKLEDYTNKLHIRDFDGTNKLIELYISSYPIEFNTKSNLLISKLKKLLKTKQTTDILDIKEVGFSSFQTVGCEDYNEYLYGIEKFHDIIEFHGNYVLKFIGKPIYEHKNMLSDMVEKELEEKYANNEVKDNNNTIHFDTIKLNDD